MLVDNEPEETDAAGCSFNIAIVTTTLLFTLLNTGIGLVRKVALTLTVTLPPPNPNPSPSPNPNPNRNPDPNQVAPHASVLTSAIVTGYCTILCYGALGSRLLGLRLGLAQP